MYVQYADQENVNRMIKNPDEADPPWLVLLLTDQPLLVIIKNKCYLSQKSKIFQRVPADLNPFIHVTCNFLFAFCIKLS